MRSVRQLMPGNAASLAYSTPPGRSHGDPDEYWKIIVCSHPPASPADDRVRTVQQPFPAPKGKLVYSAQFECLRAVVGGQAALQNEALCILEGVVGVIAVGREAALLDRLGQSIGESQMQSGLGADAVGKLHG